MKVTLTKLVHTLLADGKYFFTKELAAKELGISEAALSLQIMRLKNKGVIYSLRSGFYMIIPAEYSHMGTLPPLWIIDPLMQHLGIGYYVSLLSSSSIYGATQQQPQVFQVICDAQIPEIKLSRGAIQFHYSKNLSKAVTKKDKTPTSYAIVASKEQTVLDLVKFYKDCGYFNNVAGVLSDLCSELNPDVFKQVLANEEKISHLQRLGYILEMLDFENLAKIAEESLNKQRRVCHRKLRPDLDGIEQTRSERWKLIINDQIEIDE